MRSFIQKANALALASLALVASPAFAGGGGGIDYSILVDAIDFSTVSGAVMGAAAALAAVFIIILGVRLVLRFVRSGG